MTHTCSELVLLHNGPRIGGNAFVEDVGACQTEAVEKKIIVRALESLPDFHLEGLRAVFHTLEAAAQRPDLLHSATLIHKLAFVTESCAIAFVYCM
jgi:hypothetical protein